MEGLAKRRGSLEGQREWVKRRGVELEERKIGYNVRALELERQRFKWMKFSSKKERELERSRLDNERLRLQADRMILLVRQKELELDLRIPNASPNPPSSTSH
ncbi:hypothetical protein QJS10_CPB13g01716 [Acorus calamus]|uniref:Uncharacterized protein n=1 Tax=Acorus calamus TaxID=4465 RepID=A0AAV9DLH7_ACOCL|nr:hypothetical protein QJS10_CPB13g01716 [Acorus calamus]